MSSASLVEPLMIAATRSAACWCRVTSWANAARSSARARVSKVLSSQSASSAGRIRIELFYSVRHHGCRLGSVPIRSEEGRNPSLLAGPRFTFGQER